jgi:hypothetical protein
MDQEGIEALLGNRREDVTKVLGSDGEKRIRDDTARHYTRHARLGDRILQNFVQFVKLY